jgi:hypothetical protein
MMSAGCSDMAFTSGLHEGPVDIGIRVLVETDVGIADLHEQGLPRPAGPLPVSSRQRQLDRRENAPLRG